MKKKKVKTALNKNKSTRFWLRLFFVLVAYVVPLTILAIKFDYFTMREANLKIAGTFFILLALLAYQFKKELFKWINEWEFSLFKIVLLGFAKIWPFLLALTLIALARYGLDNLEFIIGWLAIPQSVAYLAIKPFAERADYLVKKEIRKAELKEALQENEKGI